MIVSFHWEHMYATPHVHGTSTQSRLLIGNQSWSLARIDNNLKGQLTDMPSEPCFIDRTWNKLGHTPVTCFWSYLCDIELKMYSHGSWSQLDLYERRGQKTARLVTDAIQTIFAQVAVYCDTASLTENKSRSYTGIIRKYCLSVVVKKMKNKR